MEFADSEQMKEGLQSFLTSPHKAVTGKDMEREIENVMHKLTTPFHHMMVMFIWSSPRLDNI